MPILLAALRAVLPRLLTPMRRSNSPARLRLRLGLSRLGAFDQRVQVAVEVRISRLGGLIRDARQAWIDSAHVIAAWASAGVVRGIPSPANDLLLSLAALPPVSLPHPVRVTIRALRTPVSRAIDKAENQFRELWPDGRGARHAARTFLAASAVGCLGLTMAASVLTSAAPLPAGRAPFVASPVAERHDASSAVPSELPAAEAAAPGSPGAVAPGAPATQAPIRAGTARRGALPVGKGMWIWLPTSVEGGDPVAIVSRAKAVGLTHLYVRTGSTRDGFYAQDFLNALLPVAHANGIRVYGWDFPHLNQPGDDVQRAWAAITYKTPDGHRIDGFAPDIETPSEGTNNNPNNAAAYGDWLCQEVGPDFQLIAVVPRPSAPTLARRFPYAEVVAKFDAIAPMIYWMDKDPGAEVAQAIQYLSQFGKPIIPIGQSYDGGIDGGPGGRPSPQAIIKFMQVSWQLGAPATSFWSWQHADQPTWDTIRDAGEFRLAALAPAGLNANMIRAYQHLLRSLGFQVSPTGVWDPATDAAVRSYQRSVRLAESGIIDPPTLSSLLTPFKPRLPAGVDPAP
ncbi:MAG: peptidoglycan-binding domain-containing protein [Acidimicrobiales bacterium]